MRLIIKQIGDFSKTLTFLERAQSRDYLKVLDSLARRGVQALESTTPKLTGETAGSWSYIIDVSSTKASIIWTNNVMAGRAPLAILLQYGHGTRNGGYVYGIDFINPAMKPVLDEIVNEAWRELIK